MSTEYLAFVAKVLEGDLSSTSNQLGLDVASRFQASV